MPGGKKDTKLKLGAERLGAERSVDIEAYKAELPTWHSHLLSVLGTNFSKQRQGTRPSTSGIISSPP
jgi:sulfite reductase alpha subunit-like flavoprotein